MSESRYRWLNLTDHRSQTASLHAPIPQQCVATISRLVFKSDPVRILVPLSCLEPESLVSSLIFSSRMTVPQVSHGGLFQILTSTPCIYNNPPILIQPFLLTYGAEHFLRSRQLCSPSRTSQHFMETEGSIPCSQEPSTGPYQYNPHHPILSL
jgi:hypothetical protein